MAKHSYTKEDLADVVGSSFSWWQVIDKLGLAGGGASYKNLKRACNQWDIPWDHFTGKKQEISHYRTLARKHKPYICEGCTINRWLGKELTLEVHHIDGDRMNNELSNLQYLCPNCHSQTPNFRRYKVKEV